MARLARLALPGYPHLVQHRTGARDLIVDDADARRLLQELRQALFEAEGCAPYVYTQTEQPLTMSYWSAPVAALDSPQAMLPWARLAYAAALRKPRGRTRKSTTRAPETTRKRP